MASIVIMPKQGLQMTEGTILKWLVREGGPVDAGSPLFEMETDKLTITIDALESGTLLKIIRGEGDAVPITEPIAIIGSPGEDYSALLPGDGEQPQPAAKPMGAKGEQPQPAAGPVGAKEERQPQPAAKPMGAKDGGETSAFASPRAKIRAKELGLNWKGISGSAPGGRVIEADVLAAYAAGPKATPLARKTALMEGIDLGTVTGTGPRGKITKSDISASRAPAQETASIKPMKGMRKVIAQRMKQSLHENAQTIHRVSVRMTEAARCRESLKAAGHKVSYNDMVALSVSCALSAHPKMNVELVGDGIWYKDFVNLGIAVALDEGLTVPVVKNAHQMTLSELSLAIRAAAEGARKGTLPPDGYVGGSFTISNLGMFGLEEFVAIINPPESGILAVGAIERTPVAVGDRVEIHPVMKLTLSYDHRVIDGAPAADFLMTIKKYLENPYHLL